MKNTILLGVSGDEGSFSEEAGLAYANKIGIHPSLFYLIDMEGVLNAVESGKVDIGIFPIVNLKGGLVKMAIEAMGNHLFTPIDEIWLDVKQCLLVRSGISSKQITSIVSHPQALAQCEQYLANEFSSAVRIDYQDTAKAARDLANGMLDPFSAIIASKRTSEVYELDIIAENIQECCPNLTAFIVVRRHVTK